MELFELYLSRNLIYILSSITLKDMYCSINLIHSNELSDSGHGFFLETRLSPSDQDKFDKTCNLVQNNISLNGTLINLVEANIIDMAAFSYPTPIPDLTYEKTKSDFHYMVDGFNIAKEVGYTHYMLL